MNAEEVKPPADASDFLKVFYRASSIKIRAQIRQANLIVHKKDYFSLTKKPVRDTIASTYDHISELKDLEKSKNEQRCSMR